MQRICSRRSSPTSPGSGRALTELRLDTDIDIAHGVARYLELVKLSALAQRAPEQGLEDALEDVNARLLAAATALQREILQSSPLDGTLLAAESASARLASAQSAPASEGDSPGAGADAGRATATTSVLPARGCLAAREPSLAPFLPRKGTGRGARAVGVRHRDLPQLSAALQVRPGAANPDAGDLGQRFGIVVHQVLERYHSAGGHSLEQLLDLLDAGWRRGGFGYSEAERELRLKAQTALERYHARLHAQESEPVWFERLFSLQVGPHHLRGRSTASICSMASARSTS